MGVFLVQNRDGSAQFMDQRTGKIVMSMGANDTGSAATGSLATEYGNGVYNFTKIAVNTTLPAIAGGANLGVGKLIYTFPSAPAVAVELARIDIGITQTQGNINADTPVVGLGGVIASGAVAVLSGTATFEDIMTGVAVANCTGTKKTNTAEKAKYIEPGGTKTVYLNVADGWAAGGDTGALLVGTVYLVWKAFP